MSQELNEKYMRLWREKVSGAIPLLREGGRDSEDPYECGKCLHVDIFVNFTKVVGDQIFYSCPKCGKNAMHPL